MTRISDSDYGEMIRPARRPAIWPGWTCGYADIPGPGPSSESEESDRLSWGLGCKNIKDIIEVDIEANDFKQTMAIEIRIQTL